MTKGLDQYLQDVEQLHALETNYFDDTVRPTNTSPMSETEEQVNQTSQNNLPTAKQESIDKTESAINILESLMTDTPCCDVLFVTVCHCKGWPDTNCQHDQLQDK